MKKGEKKVRKDRKCCSEIFTEESFSNVDNIEEISSISAQLLS